MRSLCSQKLLDVLSRRLKEKSMMYRHHEFKDITEIVKVRRCLIFNPRFPSDSIGWILVQPNMLTVAFPRVPFWDPFCLISTLMTYFISSKRRSCLTMLMMISCILLILIQLLSNMFSTSVVCEWWWSWTLKNARRWFSRESPMLSYHYLLKVLLYTSWYSWFVWGNIEWFPEFWKAHYEN